MKKNAKKMKQLKLTLIFTVAIIVIIYGCASTQNSSTPKDESIGFNAAKIDTLEDGSIRIIRKDDTLILKRSEKSYYAFEFPKEVGYGSNFYGVEKEKIDPPILITPNPTSSSITMTFFNKHEALFPQNITVELYYLDAKIHTFEFNNSYGVEVIPESYLTKEGMYRVVADMSIKNLVDGGGYNSIHVAAFMVMKK